MAAGVIGVAHDASSFGMVIGIISAGIMIYLFENTRGWNARMKQNKTLALEKQDEDNINIVRHIIRQCQIVAMPMLRKERLTDEYIQTALYFLHTQIDYIFTMYHKYVTQRGLDKAMEAKTVMLDIMMHRLPPTNKNTSTVLINIFELEVEIKNKNDHELVEIRDLASG